MKLGKREREGKIKIMNNKKCYREHAKYYYNLGFNITCISDQKNEYNSDADNVYLKAPNHPWNHLHEERQSVNEFNSYYWQIATGFGVVTGYNNLLTIDLDDCDPKFFIETVKQLGLPNDYEWVVSSGSRKGFHIYVYIDDLKLYYPTETVIRLFPKEQYEKFAEKVELLIRIHSILPPSLYSSGNKYKFMNCKIPKSLPVHICYSDLQNYIDLYFDQSKQCDMESYGLEEDDLSGEIRDSTSETIEQKSYKQIYDDYINSDLWKNKKKKISGIYKRNEWAIECVRCGKVDNLQVHHNYYIDNKYFGHENISDTDYLCAKCHKEWHKIQKSSGSSQNRLSEEYYNFITADKTRIDQIDYLLTEKIKVDTLEVERYFSRADVVKYNKISDKLNWILLISIILLFVYGIGIIVMIIGYFISLENKEPENFDLYKQKKDSLESKKCYLELRKYHNHN